VHAQLQGRLKLIRFQRGEQRRANRVVEHRCDKRAEDIPGWVREVLARRERELDRALLDVGVNELEPSVAAARGIGARPSTPSQKGPNRWFIPLHPPSR
jgi:hypothetical protein